MFKAIARWLSGDKFFPKQGIDDILNLSTGMNLEEHANDAANEIDKQLIVVKEHESEVAAALVDAQARYTLANSMRINKERLAQSIASVFDRLRK